MNQDPKFHENTHKNLFQAYLILFQYTMSQVRPARAFEAHWADPSWNKISEIGEKVNPRAAGMGFKPSTIVSIKAEEKRVIGVF